MLEDSGYLARAAFLMDRLLARVGLHGKSFIPLLSSFACAIPGILATRTIDSRKDRLATILVAPFMTCSARLPVYTLLIESCFAPVLPKEWQASAKGLIMLACYLAGIVIAALAAWALRLSVLRRGAPSTFILEMPSYKLPQLTEVARQMWVNSKSFLTKAGTVIFTLSVLLWASMYWPRLDSAHLQAIARSEHQATPAPGDTRTVDERIDDRTQAEQVAHSYAGAFGHAIAPALAPIGVDWKTSIGLVGAFAAREVFVSTLGIVHGVGDTEKRGGAREALPAAMQADRGADGRMVWTPLAAASVLLWFVIAMQCMSTIAVVAPREDWRLGLADLHAGVDERPRLCLLPGPLPGWQPFPECRSLNHADRHRHRHRRRLPGLGHLPGGALGPAPPRWPFDRLRMQRWLSCAQAPRERARQQGQRARRLRRMSVPHGATRAWPRACQSHTHRPMPMRRSIPDRGLAAWIACAALTAAPYRCSLPQMQPRNRKQPSVSCCRSTSWSRTTCR